MTGTGNSVAVREAASPAALAIQAGQTAFDKMQLAALRQLGLDEASEGDLAVFLHQAQRTGLDPFARQIYMIGRNEKVPGSQNQWRKKYSIQTGIDGLRVMRARAEAKAGVRGILSRPVYYDAEGGEHKVWFQRLPPVAVEMTYTVREATGETPYTSILRFTEYAQYKDEKLTGQWASKGVHMLEKCTEADVYRKAFPQDFSGVQLDDAMPAPDPDAPPAQPQRQRVTAEQARQRASQAIATVVTTPEGPSPAGTEPPVSAPPAAGEQPAGEATIEDLDAALTKLGVRGLDAQLKMAGRLNGTRYRYVGELTPAVMAAALSMIRNCTDGNDLDGLLAELDMAAGEVPGA